MLLMLMSNRATSSKSRAPDGLRSGAVNRPGAYLMQEDGKLDVTQAIALAYGTSIQASTGKIRIIRRNPDGSLLEIPVHYKRQSRLSRHRLCCNRRMLSMCHPAA